MLNLYQEIVMDHYRNPRNYGIIEGAHFMCQERNSACGDEVTFSGIIQDNALVLVGFEGKGCVISLAMASMLAQHVKNKNINDILAIDKDQIVAMIGMPLGPVRLLCALLPLTALQKGISKQCLIGPN